MQKSDIAWGIGAVLLVGILVFFWSQREGEVGLPVGEGDTRDLEKATGTLPAKEEAEQPVLPPLQEPVGDMGDITSRGQFTIERLPIGTDIGKELPAITEEYFPVRVLYTQEGKTTYRQYIRFGERGQDIDSGRVEFTENEFGEVGPFLTFQQGDIIFEYGIIFDNGLRAQIENNQLDDLHNKELIIWGKSAIITSSRIYTQNNRVQLRMVTGGRRALIAEGDTHYFFTGFSSIPISVLQISSETDPQVTLAINGVRAPAIRAGNRIIDEEEGISVNVIRVMPNAAEDGKDLIDVAIGPATVVIEDIYNDDQFSTSVEVNGRRQTGTIVQIRGTVVDEIFRMSSIKFRAKAETGDIYIPPGSSLAEQTGTGGTDIQYGGLSDAPTTLIVFDGIGSRYLLSFTNNNGQPYRVPLLDASGTFQYGDDDQTLWFVETSSSTDYQIAEGDYVVLTSSNNRRGETRIVKFDQLDTSNKLVTFTDLGGGQQSVSYEETGVAGQRGEGTLTFGSINARFTVGDNGNIAMDLDKDGQIASDEANIVVLGGGILDLGSTQSISGVSQISMSLTTERTKIQDATSSETVTININRDGSTLDVDVADQTNINMHDAGSKLWQGLTVYGAFFELSGTSGRSRTLAIEYPYTQRFVNVGVQT